ncbi:drug/metabolite transporter (DMT)-like permease [Peribacillus deserti]|uniref:Drug/metabolite transporter (DMT)-like permease n=1 Tax=Peribacillus deserti TaxID=673318 RepID=A0ABS2QHY0_9BACI|nr:DMT family transporter [Peribacillus deserti]MBM7692575.1 drug/metabolite transporter (DMT)-like permease [Peribacillus deserti]
MKKSLYADISLLLVALIWGVSFVLVQNAISHLEPFSFNAIRFLIAAIFLIIWQLLKKQTILQLFSKDILSAGMKIGFWLFLGYALQTIGLLYTSPAKAGFITGLSIVIVPILSLILMKQMPSINTAAGVIAATAGLYMMTMLGEASFTKSDMLILIASFSFAMHVVTTGKYAKDYPVFPLTIIQLSVVALLSIVCGLFFEEPAHNFSFSTLFRPEVWQALFITSIFATAAAFLVQTHAQQFTSPTRVALTLSTEPVFAAITSYIWIHEILSVYAIIGCILIFSGIILSELPIKKKPRDSSILESPRKRSADN